MHYVLYDKDFNAIGVRKTYPCSSWTLHKNANEFDELTIEGMAIENDDSAMYVGLHDEYKKIGDLNSTNGNLISIAFAGIPETKNGKTKINAIDIRQLLNNDCVIDFTNVDTVSDVYIELLGCLFNENRNGYRNLGVTVVEPDVDEINYLLWKDNSIEKIKASGNVWKTMQAVNSIYDCYIDVVVDFINKTIKFKVKRIMHTLNIKLSDFGVSKIKRDLTKINRAVCYVTGEYSQRAVYYLQSDEIIAPESSVDTTKILYPAIIEVFEEDSLESAKNKGIQKLYENRYKAAVEIPLENEMSYLLKNIDLSYMINIHEYKSLPVMQLVYQNSQNITKIKLGRLEEYWWQ